MQKDEPASVVSTLATSVALAAFVGCQPATTAPPPSTPDDDTAQMGPPSDADAEPQQDAEQTPAHAASDVDPSGEPGDPHGVSETQVESFARAYVAVAMLEQQYTQELQSVSSREEADAIQQQARNEMQDAIEDAGMSVTEFEQLGVKAERDEALQIRIQHKIVELERQEETP